MLLFLEALPLRIHRGGGVCGPHYFFCHFSFGNEQKEFSFSVKGLLGVLRTRAHSTQLCPLEVLDLENAEQGTEDNWAQE